jgi:U32 family peptidase
MSIGVPRVRCTFERLREEPDPPRVRPMSRPEVLAPAGDRAAMEAAVRGGADAVYFGLHGLNARARAANFDLAELNETMRYLHAHGVKGYVAMNTLLFDDELERAKEAIRACADAGVDALIVQDLGVARLVRELAPHVALHASTQMTCTDAGSVQFAAELGAQRVILARELSLPEIEQIRAGAPDVELEVFVHGALCIAYSGQCLTSEAIGGRSANRGACAQACRLPYDLVVDGVVTELGDRAYLLSPQDLEASSVVPELVRLGISSLKIEGRLKGPEYVGAAARLYRQAISAALGQAAPPDDAQRNDALQMYSRGSGPGFFEGVDHQRLVDGRTCDHRGRAVGTLAGFRNERGKTWLELAATTEVARGDGLLVEGGRANQGEVGGRVWDVAGNAVWLGPDVDVRSARIGARVWKTSDPAATKRVATVLAQDPHRVALDLKLSAGHGEHPVLEGRSERGHFARVELDTPLEAARARPLDRERIRAQLELPPNSMLPISALNRARRALIDALRPIESELRAVPSTPRARRTPFAPSRPTLRVLCRTLEQARAAHAAGADSIGLDFLALEGTGDAVRALRAEGVAHITLAPPRIRKPGEEKIDRFLESLRPDAILVRGLGALRAVSSAEASIERIADFSLNVTNHMSAREVLDRGVTAFTPAFDLDAAQLLSLLSGELSTWAEVVLHHPMPLFHMEHCVIAALLSEGRDYRTCGRPCESHQISLRDRAGSTHPVEADVGCRNTVFHERAQSAAELAPALLSRNVTRYRIELVRESAADVTRIIQSYRALLDGTLDRARALAALRTESGYGVVRGSLRVLA